MLAHAGVGSRRACEDLILQGRVTINGTVVRELGTRVEPGQKIAVDGEPIHEERLVYYAVHKPKGYVSTNKDPAGRPRVIDLLPEVPQRVYAVGRLDEQSTGLILLTNDGELANRLAHPKFGVEKLYRVVVAGEPGREVFDKLIEGVWLAEGKVRAKRVKPVARRGQATVLEMTLAEGKNREIRRMLAKFGHKVMSLTRIAVGPVALKGLPVGEARPLSQREIEMLRQAALGLRVGPPEDADRRPRQARPGGKPPRPAGRRVDESEGQAPPAGVRPARPARPPMQGGPPPPARPPGPANRRPAGPGGPGGQRPVGPGVGRPSGPGGQRPAGPGGQRPAGPYGNRPPVGGPGPYGNRPPVGGPGPYANRPPVGGPGPNANRPQVGGPGPYANRPQVGGPGPRNRRPPVGGPGGPPPGPQQGRRPGGPPPMMDQGPPPHPPGPRSRRPPVRPEGPTRQIIGLDSGPFGGHGEDGPPGPRRRRPVPKRSPRAALGVKRSRPAGGPRDTGEGEGD